MIRYAPALLTALLFGSSTVGANSLAVIDAIELPRTASLSSLTPQMLGPDTWFAAYGNESRSTAGVVITRNVNTAGSLEKLGRAISDSGGAIIDVANAVRSSHDATRATPTAIIVNRTETGQEDWRQALPYNETLAMAGQPVELRWAPEEDVFAFFVDGSDFDSVREAIVRMVTHQVAYQAFISSLLDLGRSRINEVDNATAEGRLSPEEGRRELRYLRVQIHAEYAAGSDYPGTIDLAPLLGEFRSNIERRHSDVAELARVRIGALDADASSLDEALRRAEDSADTQRNLSSASFAAWATAGGTAVAALGLIGTAVGYWKARPAKPQLQVRIWREDPAWVIEATVSVAAAKPPIMLYSLRGTLSPRDKHGGTGWVQSPVILDPGPGPTAVIVKSFQTKIVRALGQGGDLELVVHLVSSSGSFTHVYDVDPSGSWSRRRGALMRWWEQRRLNAAWRRMEREAAERKPPMGPPR